MGFSSSHNIPNTNVRPGDRIKALSTRPTSIDSFFSSESCRFHNSSCEISDVETSRIVNEENLVELSSVEMHFFIWARLPSVQVSPHHWRPPSAGTILPVLLERRAKHNRFRYIGLDPASNGLPRASPRTENSKLQLENGFKVESVTPSDHLMVETCR